MSMRTKLDSVLIRTVLAKAVKPQRATVEVYYPYVSIEFVKYIVVRDF